MTEGQMWLSVLGNGLRHVTDVYKRRRTLDVILSPPLLLLTPSTPHPPLPSPHSRLHNHLPAHEGLSSQVQPTFARTDKAAQLNMLFLLSFLPLPNLFSCLRFFFFSSFFLLLLLLSSSSSSSWSFLLPAIHLLPAFFLLQSLFLSPLCLVFLSLCQYSLLTHRQSAHR